MKRIIIITIGMLMWGCSNDPDLGPVILTVDVDADFADTYTNQWIFVSDKEGKVLDTKQITGSQKIHLISASPDDTVTMTVVQDMSWGSSQSLYFTSYAGIPAGTALSLKEQEDISYDHSETHADVSVNGYTPPDIYNAHISASNAETSVTLNQTDPSIPQTYTQILTGHSPAFTVMLSAYSQQNTPVYLIKTQSATNAKIEASFSEFKPFPKTIKLPAAEWINGSLFAHMELKPGHQGYQMSLYEFGDTDVTPRYVGYLDNYSTYDFYCSASRTLSNKYYVVDYFKRGAINPAPEIPLFMFEVISTNPSSASIMTSHHYTMKSTYYNNHLPSEDDFRWQVVSPMGSAPKITELPPVIQEKYPNISFDTFEYSRTIFSRWVDGTSYAKVIDSYLNSDYSGPTYEYYNFWAFE